MAINGILLGGVYALISIGLTLIFGVMNIINFAHGEFLMLSMYITFWLFHLYGVDPYLSILLIMPVFFLLGILVQRVIIQPILNAPHIAQIFATVGLSIVMQNAALLAWKADYRSIRVAYGISNIKTGGLIISFPRLVTFAIAIAIVIGLFIFLKETLIGRAIRATAQNVRAALLMGINTNRIYFLAFALGTVCVGIAGGLLAPLYPTYPTVGAYFVLIAFVIVVLGGMGSMVGALLGGLLIGVVEVFSGFYVAPALKELFCFIVFIMILIFRPSGLMGKRGLSR
jgi:branched-chain amino acid transport system permease protein